MRSGPGRLGRAQRLRRQPVSFSEFQTGGTVERIELTDLDSSDFENKFVCGEIMSYEDLREYGSEASVKAAGKLRQQGKPYESTSFFFLSSFCSLSVYELLTYLIFITVVDGDIAYWKAGA